MKYRIALQFAGLGTAIATTLLFVPALLDPFNLPKLAVLVIGVAVGVGLLAGFSGDWFTSAPKPLLVATGGFALALITAGVASEQPWYRTLFGTWARNGGMLAYLSLTVLLLLFALSTRVDTAPKILNALTLVGGIECTYGLLQWTGNDFVAWNNPYNPIIGTVGNPNFASALLSLATIATTARVLDTSLAPWQRAGLATLAVLNLFIIFQSDAQQGLLAFAIGMVVVGAVWLRMQRVTWARNLMWPWLGAAGIGFALFLPAMFNVGPLAKWVYVLSVRRRNDYWDAAWEMIKAHPLFGVGIDSYGDWFRFYRLPQQVEMNGTPDVVSNNAHNVVLQLGATGGLVLMLGYLLLMAFVTWRAAIVLRRPTERLLGATLVGAWVAFQAQSLISIDQLGLTVWGWVLAGGIIGLSYTPATESVPPVVKRSAAPGRAHASRPEVVSTPTGMALALGAVLGLGALLLVIPAWSGDAAVRRATSYQVDTGNAQQVQFVKEQLLSAADGKSEPAWLLRAASGLLAIGAIEEGIDVAEAGVAAYPADALLWDAIARAYEQTGRPAEAVTARARTAALDPLNDTFAELLTADRSAR